MDGHEGEHQPSGEESSTVACPTCKGPLNPGPDGWVCVVGHRFSAEELTEAQTTASVRAFWYALRAIQDRYITNEYTATQMERDGRGEQATKLRAKSRDDLAMVDSFHDLVRKLEGDGPRPPGEPVAGSHS